MIPVRAGRSALAVARAVGHGASMQAYVPTERPWLQELVPLPPDEPRLATPAAPTEPATCARCEEDQTGLCAQHAALVVELL
jgi:hypothetical protein